MLPLSDVAPSLEQMGLSHKESLVYSALLRAGGAFPSRLAEETRLNRTTVYKILLDLSVKGLVNEIEKKNKLFYQIESPSRLLRYVKNQVTRAEDHLQAAQKMLPDFEGLYSAFTNKPRVTYFEGAAGVASIYEDMVAGKEKYEMLAFSNASAFERIIPKKVFEDFRKAKERIGITTRGIIPDTEQDKTYVARNFTGMVDKIHPEVRFVPQDQFPFKGEIVIYGTNKVAIVNLNKEFLTGVVIEDETIHNMMQMIFELSWRGASAAVEK